MSERKLFAQRAGLMGLTQILSMIIRVLLVPILSKNMPVSDYGVWVQVNATIGLIPPLMGLGLSAAILRFLAPIKDKKEFQGEFYSIFAVVATISGIFSLVFFIFADPISQTLFNGNLEVARALSVILFTESLITLPINVYGARQKIRIHSIFVLIDMILTVFLASYFILMGYGIYGAVIGILISKMLVLISMMIIVISKIGFSMPKFINIKKYMSFSIPLLPNNLSNWILNSSDRYIITLFLGTTFVGYYGPGYTVGHLISMFAAPLIFLLTPVLSKYYDEEKFNEFSKVLRYSTKYYLFLAIPSVFGLSILSKSILTILSTSEIASIGYLITPFTAVSYLLYGLKGIIGNVLIVQNKTKIIGFVVSISAIINLGLNIIIIPIMGINGAALTTLVSFILSFLVILYYSSKARLFNFDISFIIKSLIASIVMSLIIIYLNPVGIFLLLISIILGAIVYFGIILTLKGITKEEIKFFRNLLRY